MRKTNRQRRSPRSRRIPLTKKAITIRVMSLDSFSPKCHDFGYNEMSHL